MNCRIPSGLWCFDKHQFSNLSCLIFDKGFMKLLRCLLLWRVNSMSFDGSWKIKTFLVWTFESSLNMAHCSGVIVHESYFFEKYFILVPKQMKQKYWRTWNVEWGTKSVDLAIRSLEASKIFESSLQESAALTTYNSLLLHISPGPATIFLNWWTETSLRINQRHRNQQMLSWRKNDDFIHWTNKPREDLFHCSTDESTCWPFLLPEENVNQIPYCAELNIIFHACSSTDQ